MFSISKNIDYILKMINDLLGLIKMHLFKFISLLFHIFFIIILKKLQKNYFIRIKNNVNHLISNY